MGPSPRRTPCLSVVTVLAVLGASFGAILWTAPSASAVTYVGGWITADTTWGVSDTEYVITQHVTVRPGVTLTILQGTTIRMDPGRALFVEGRLVVQGSPGNEVDFRANTTAALFPPQGIQFNASSTGSVDRATFDRFERPVTAIDSSPWIGSNYVGQAFYAFYLVRSNDWVWGNTIDRATVGIYAIDSDVSIASNTVRGTLTGIQVTGGAPTVTDNVIDGATTGVNALGSDAQILRNQVNGTSTGIQAAGGGVPTIADNLVTNVTGPLAAGIRVTAGTPADVWRNTVSGVQGARGLNALGAGNPGAGGGLGIGILIDNAPTATVRENTITGVYGGRGGDGAANFTGVGGPGGDGGVAAGIVIGAVNTADVGANIISDVLGGRGGSGGGAFGTSAGGPGGDGGDAAGIEALGIAVSGLWVGNQVDAISGGAGGSGGDGSGPDGAGGAGGDAYGVFTFDAASPDVSGNGITNIRGGFGGNSTTGLGNGDGGAGGAAAGVAVTHAAGTSIVHSNSVWNVVGGDGGRGGAGGAGGNASGAYVLGKGDGNYNATTATGNWFQDTLGGDGAVGLRAGGAGGAATGIAVAMVAPYLGGNAVWNAQGGAGGDSNDGSDGGRGGDAAGIAAYIVPSGWSAGDGVVFVFAGAAGVGPPTLASYGVGVYMEGSASVRTAFTIENTSLGFIGSRDLWVGDFADGTTINAPFDPSKLAVEATSTLTVKNYLSVDIYWPDGVTRVAGASVLVQEDGVPVWNFVSGTGYSEWLLTTDRVYENSANTPEDVQNEVAVTFLAYGFQDSPRTVDMFASNLQTFIMIDGDAPTSAAVPLPAYTATSTFPVGYTASDGSGAGLGNITLWYRRDGGGWTPYATQPAAPSGQFTFTAGVDGTYEFQTIADDLAGNVEPGPGGFGNESWTIVDTTRPGSAVSALPLWTTSQTFLVSWGPDGGVADIVRYTIQFNRGFGWTDWLIGTTQTSGMFTATQPTGVYQFRSIATDAAGNVEIPPATNDTFTFVDIWAPESWVLPLSMYQTTLSFTVSWAREADDVASFRIDVRDNGGAWTTWIPSTTATSATFTGQDAHVYEFRSVATDYAGNVEPVGTGNESWTIVDVTPPNSAVAPLPTFTASLTIGLSWGPVAGTTDITKYTIQVSDNGGPWTNVPGLVDTTATSGSYTGLDGHTYGFRSIAKDRAGNVEPAAATNDTWTVVDVTPPSSTHVLGGTLGGAGWWTSAVTVTLSSTDATSGVERIDYRIDGGAWQAYSGPFQVSGDGAHTVEYHGRDYAGLAEADRTATFNVDTTPPTTSATLTGTRGDAGWHTSPVIVTLTPTDDASGPGATAYRVNGGPWQTYTGPVTVATDGVYTMDFYTTDVAGLAEARVSTTFRIDTTEPTVVASQPRGAGTNTTPWIIVTFSEGMNRTSVEQAFTLNPDMNGAFTWSADNRTVTFRPDRELQPGTTYFVAVDSRAKDVAGNALRTISFSFETSAGPPTGGGPSAGDFLWIVAVVAAALGGTILIVVRRLGARAKPTPAAAAKPESTATIDDVFLLYRDGILIKHETRRLKPDIDTDILSGMLTAVQSFVKDSFRSEEGELDELTFGEMHILIGRGKWLILAAMVQGDGTSDFRPQIEKCISEMEANHAEAIETWDGNMTIAKTLTPYVKKLIRGEYA